MAAKDELARIVRSKDFARSTPEQQQDFVIGYFRNRQPSVDHRAAFSQFDDARQRKIADEAIRRTAEPTTGEIAQGAIEKTARWAGPLAATAGLSGAGPVTAAAVPAAMISEFAPEVTRPFLTGQAADLAGALERSAESGLLSLAIGPVEKVAGMAGKAVGGLRSRIMGTRSFKDPKTGQMVENPDVAAARSVLEPRGGGLTLGQQRGSGRGFFENISRNAILGEGKVEGVEVERTRLENNRAVLNPLWRQVNVGGDIPLVGVQLANIGLDGFQVFAGDGLAQPFFLDRCEIFLLQNADPPHIELVQDEAGVFQRHRLPKGRFLGVLVGGVDAGGYLFIGFIPVAILGQRVEVGVIGRAWINCTSVSGHNGNAVVHAFGDELAHE